MDWLLKPWPWYIAGPLIGLMIPLLLVLGNKSFGISSNFRHICAACFPSNISFFQYDWRKETWNLFFAIGILLGGVFTLLFIPNPDPVSISAELQNELATYRVTKIEGLLPPEIFNWQSLLTIKGFVLVVVGGFLIGFGTRYAGGCTSGHAIMGLATLQWASLIATICFMAGGFFVANLVLPLILSL